MFRAVHDRENPYVMVTKPAINDKKVSLAARGLLAWLLDKPDDYPIEPGRIAKANGISVYESKKLLKELSVNGYLVAPDDRAKGENGKYIPTPYTLRENPCIPTADHPCDEIHEPETTASIPQHGNHDMESSAWKSTDGARAESKHKNSPLQITKTNNINNQEQEKTKTKTDYKPVDKQESPDPDPVAVSSVYVIPEIVDIDLWEKDATTLPGPEKHQPPEARAIVPEAMPLMGVSEFEDVPGPNNPEATKTLPEIEYKHNDMLDNIDRVIPGLKPGDPPLYEPDPGWKKITEAYDGAIGGTMGESIRDALNDGIKLRGHDAVLELIESARYAHTSRYKFLLQSLINWHTEKPPDRRPNIKQPVGDKPVKKREIDRWFLENAGG